MIVRFYNIQWDYGCPDCSGENSRPNDLPNEHVMEFDAKFDEKEMNDLDSWLDALSYKFNWCVDKADIEWVD